MAGTRGHYRSKATPSKARVLAIAEFCAAKGLKVSHREIFKAENVAESTGRQWLKEVREPRQKITDPTHPDFREHGNRRLTIDDVERIEQMLYRGGPDARTLPWERLPDAAGCLFDGRSKPSGPTVRRVMHRKNWKKCTACRWLVQPGTVAGTCGCGMKVSVATEPQGLDPGPGAGDAQLGAVQAGAVQAGAVQAGEVQAGEVQAGHVQTDQAQTDQVPHVEQVQAQQVQVAQVPAESVQAGPVEAEHVQAEHALHAGGMPQWAAS